MNKNTDNINSTENNKKQKNQKTVKLVKKAPSFYRKKYTEKTLETKIYKKIFVPADKEFVKSLIEQTGTKGSKQIPVYGIPKEKLFSKKDFKRLKVLAKQIKKQKGRIKAVPFIAVAGFIASVAIIFTLTKNIIIKKGIQNVCENFFEARCDIAKVNFKFFDASLKINGLEIADKNDTMKDIIYIDSIALDFDLTQALRARFVADELSVLGVETGKERSFDGKLSAKKAKKIAKKKAKSEKAAAKDSALSLAISDKLDAAKSASQNSVTELFSQYNPETIINNCYASLQTPAAAEKISSQIPALISKWESKPDEMKQKVEKVQSSVQNLIDYDFGSIASDPAKIAQMVSTIESAISSVDSLKNETSSVVNGIAGDTKTVSNLSAEINSAIKHDKDFAAQEINKIKDFSIKGESQNAITGILNNVMYSVLGKYYPYYETAMQKLSESKSNSSDKAEAKKAKSKKKGIARSNGRCVTYKKDTVPSLWIKKAAGSGPNFSAFFENISNDMNKLGLPATGKADAIISSITHHADFIVDTRDADNFVKDNPLVTVKYSGKNYPFNLDSSAFGGGQGTPSFNATTQINADVLFDENNTFALFGSGIFTDLKITTEPFEPEFASQIYSSVMSKITKMTVNVKAAYDDSDGLRMEIYSDADRQFASALSKEMNARIDSVKKQAVSELSKKLEDISKDALGEIGSFSSIMYKLDNCNLQADSLKKQLENKKKEGQNYAKKQAENAAKEAAKEGAKELENQGKKLLKGFGF